MNFWVDTAQSKAYLSVIDRVCFPDFKGFHRRQRWWRRHTMALTGAQFAVSEERMVSWNVYA